MNLKRSYASNDRHSRNSIENYKNNDNDLTESMVKSCKLSNMNLLNSVSNDDLSDVTAKSKKYLFGGQDVKKIVPNTKYEELLSQ